MIRLAKPKCQAEIEVEPIRAGQRWATCRQLAIELGMSPSATRPKLAAMIADGKLRQIGNATGTRYNIADFRKALDIEAAT